MLFFFFKQKTAYEMRMSDWSSDVCSSDLLHRTLDIKTNRSFLRDASPKYQFDNQQTPYGIALSHVTGVPIDEFEVLYLDCFVDLVEPRTTLYSYHRDSTDIEEWLVN